jgi:hypothetical protein
MVTRLTAQEHSGGWDEPGTGMFQGTKAVQSNYVTRGIVTHKGNTQGEQVKQQSSKKCGKGIKGM